MTVQVWTAFDENYFYPALVSMYSAKFQLNEDVWINVGYDENLFSKKSLAAFLKVSSDLGLKVKFSPLKMPSNLPTLGHINSITFGRLELLSILVEKFVWIDIDTIFVHGIKDLIEFSNTLPDDFSFCALPSPLKSNVGQVVHKPNAAVLRSGSRYFNAGIFIADPVKWRNNGFALEWTKLVEDYELYGFVYLDQCVLNYLYSGNYADLPRMFNFIPGAKDHFLDETRILHFAGPVKPWLFQPKQLIEVFRKSQLSLFFKFYYAQELAIFLYAFKSRNFHLVYSLVKFKFFANTNFYRSLVMRKTRTFLRILMQ